MGALIEIVRRLHSLGRRRVLEDRLDDEIRFHVEHQIDKNVRLGMSADEARRQALIRFGGVEQMRERTRDEFRASFVETLARDVRYGLRSLRRHPSFSTMAVLSLAVGIGANAAIFGVAHAVFFRPSPLTDLDTLVNIYEAEGERRFGPPSYPTIEDLRRGTADVFRGIAASTFAPGQIDHAGTVGTVMGEAVTGNTFALLGIEPHLGRAIQPADDVARGGHPVVMLSYGYWQRAFASDPQVVGRTLQIGRRRYTIVGVAPADYRGALPAIAPAFYVSTAMLEDVMGIEMLDQRDFHSFIVKARLAPGVTRAQAEHAASLVAASLNSSRPEGWRPGQQFNVVPTSDIQVHPILDPFLRAAAWLLIGVVALVLLLACTNLASFLVARALDREHEVALRRALGATRGALARQLLVESAILGVGGAAAGLVLAIVLINSLLSIDLPLPLDMRLDLHLGIDWKVLFDWRVLVFTASAGVFAGVLLALVPAVQGTRTDPGSTLKTGSKGSELPESLRWRNVLVVAQIAMSLVLLVGAGLFLRSWQQSLSVDPGFGRAPTSLLNVVMPLARSTPDHSASLMRNLLERFRALPGVEAAGLIFPLPLDLNVSFTDFTIDGRIPPSGGRAFRADRAEVDGGFFEAAGIAVVDGRTFSDDDRRESQPVAIISQAMARRYWPNGSALGQILRRSTPERDVMIVGVVSDISVQSLGEAPRDLVYEPYTQGEHQPGVTFLVRTRTDPGRLLLTLADVAQQADPDLRVMQSKTMAEHLAVERLPSQIGAVVLAVFAVLGMALAAVGVYGMVRHSVAMRTREVGIRMALGADAADVTRLLTTRGIRLVLIGGVIGGAASLLAARSLGSLLFSVGRFDPVALIGAPLVLGVAAWLAAYLPARRASRLNPLASLRME